LGIPSFEHALAGTRPAPRSAAATPLSRRAVKWHIAETNCGERILVELIERLYTVPLTYEVLETLLPNWLN